MVGLCTTVKFTVDDGSERIVLRTSGLFRNLLRVLVTFQCIVVPYSGRTPYFG